MDDPMFNSRRTSRPRNVTERPAARQKGPGTSPSRQEESNTAVATVDDLSSLDRRSIAVHLTVQGRERVFHGVGAYEADPDLGGVLRVAVQDNAGGFEMLLVEGQWTGTIESGAAVGCDYLLRVG